MKHRENESLGEQQLNVFVFLTNTRIVDGGAPGPIQITGAGGINCRIPAISTGDTRHSSSIHTWPTRSHRRVSSTCRHYSKEEKKKKKKHVKLCSKRREEFEEQTLTIIDHILPLSDRPCLIAIALKNTIGTEPRITGAVPQRITWSGQPCRPNSGRCLAGNWSAGIYHCIPATLTA